MSKSDERPLPGKTSKEADRKQLRLARDQGDAFTKSLEAMREEAGRGKSIKVQDYMISYAEENAEGMYEWTNGQLEWRNPDFENCHLEITVQDSQDGRFIPYLDVSVSIFPSGDDEQLLTVKLPFLWHPWLFHYGTNIAIPESGNYDLLVSVSELKVNRHDHENGQRYTHPVETLFTNVPLTTGQKRN